MIALYTPKVKKKSRFYLKRNLPLIDGHKIAEISNRHLISLFEIEFRELKLILTISEL